VDIMKKIDRFIADIRPAPSDAARQDRLNPGTRPFITLSSQSGAGGHTLAEKLIERLAEEGEEHRSLRDWRVFDKDMCRHILEEDDLTEAVIELLDEEYHSQINEFVSGIFGRGGLQNVAYVKLSRLIRTVASIGKVIILGHGGALATRGLSGGTHIRLVAPQALRATRMAPLLDVDAHQSARLIQQRDDEQRKLLKTHYRVDGTDPEVYDLVANTERMHPESVAGMVVTLLHRRVG